MFGINRRNVYFVLFFMFLLTFIILLITEVSFSTYQKHHTYSSRHETSKTENFSNKKTDEQNSSNFSMPAPTDAVWQKVPGSRHKFFVYSAYLDKRSKRQWIVRLIAATRTRNAEKPSCTFYYPEGKDGVSGKIATISEHWGLPYSAVFINCALKNTSQIPLSVSVAILGESRTTYEVCSNRVIINNGITDFSLSENKDKIAACVKPIYNFDQSFKVTEFVELSRLLGISHFTFYNASMGPSTSCLLEEYARKGIVSVYPWQLAIESKTQIRTEGMFAALNDCLYRYMHHYPYVAFIDIDEFIVPRLNMTIIDMIKWLNRRYNTSNVSSFSFQNAFFYLQWADDPMIKLPNDVEKHMISVRKTRRKVKLNSHKKRSKFIVKPKNVVEVGNHFVWQFFYNHNTLNVPPSVAILNHYRVCEFGGDDCVLLPSTVDRTLYRYRRQLTCKVAQRWSSVSKRCIMPIPDHFNLDRLCNV